MRPEATQSHFHQRTPHGACSMCEIPKEIGTTPLQDSHARKRWEASLDPALHDKHRHVVRNVSTITTEYGASSRRKTTAMKTPGSRKLDFCAARSVRKPRTMGLYRWIHEANAMWWSPTMNRSHGRQGQSQAARCVQGDMVRTISQCLVDPLSRARAVARRRVLNLC